MIPVEHAEAQAEVLLAAAKDSPIPTIGAMLRARGQEWRSAVKWYRDATDEGEQPAIVPAALMEQGVRVWWGGSTAEIIRVANGGTGVQLAEAGFGARWENRLGPQSPVVVLA